MVDSHGAKNVELKLESDSNIIVTVGDIRRLSARDGEPAVAEGLVLNSLRSAKMKLQPDHYVYEFRIGGDLDELKLILSDSDGQVVEE